MKLSANVGEAIVFLMLFFGVFFWSVEQTEAWPKADENTIILIHLGGVQP